MQNMENSPWRAVIFGAGASLFLFILAFLLLAPGNREYFNIGAPEKIAKFSKLHVIGREDGKLAYKLYAEKGWSTQKNNITILNNLGPGSLYQDGQLIAQNLHARYAKIYKESQEVEAFSTDPDNQGQKPLLYVYLDLGRFAEGAKKKKFTLISAKYLHYFKNHKKTILKENVAIREKNTTTDTPYLEVFHEPKTAFFPQGITLRRKELELKGEKGFFSSKKEEMEIDQASLNISHKNKTSRTTLTCGKIILFSDPEKDIIASQEIRVLQPKKIAFAQNASYNQDKKTFVLKGQAKVIIEKFADILKTETLKNIDAKETQEAIKEKTTLQANTLTIFTNNEDAVAESNVVVDQKGKQAMSDYAVYSDQDDQIILTRNVYIKKAEQWLKAEKVIVSVKDETMEAFGKVKSEFTIKK